MFNFLDEFGMSAFSLECPGQSAKDGSRSPMGMGCKPRLLFVYLLCVFWRNVWCCCLQIYEGTSQIQRL